MGNKLILNIVFGLLTLSVFSQEEPKENTYRNITEKMLASDGNLIIGGYGEVHYNQPLNSDIRNNGVLDVHRMVMLYGYRFNEKTQFITELEFEHVSEVYVEQAFLQYKLNSVLNLRGGLMLIPMGITNEYHEPVSFNGVERPLIDNVVAPSTWREVGFGISGNIIPASLKYQAYIVNGFNGYDGLAHLGGKNGLRSGRQKGAESFISAPNLTFKLEYYGIGGLNTGLSGYFGKTQSSLFDGINKNDNSALVIADSSVVGISMIGIDARFNKKAFELKGQFYYASISNTDEYNLFTANNGTSNDLGSTIMGFYAEAGYNVLSLTDARTSLIPFVRYETYDLHQKVESRFTKNPSYNVNAITTGVTWKMDKGAVFKTDLQFVKSEAEEKFNLVFNTGIGVMF